jgi:hypothetical protein
VQENPVYIRIESGRPPCWHAFLQGLQKQNGNTAYQLPITNPHTSTQIAFLLSGSSVVSAFQIISTLSILLPCRCTAARPSQIPNAALDAFKSTSTDGFSFLLTHRRSPSTLSFPLKDRLWGQEGAKGC